MTISPQNNIWMELQASLRIINRHKMVRREILSDPFTLTIDASIRCFKQMKKQRVANHLGIIKQFELGANMVLFIVLPSGTERVLLPVSRN